VKRDLFDRAMPVLLISLYVLIVVALAALTGDMVGLWHTSLSAECPR
jgi:hypothetical protein